MQPHRLPPALLLIPLLLGIAGTARAQEESPPRATPTATEVMAFLAEHMPELREEVRRIEREEPEAYADYLAELAEQVADYREIHAQAPDLAESLLQAERLEFASWQLGQSIAAAGHEEERARLTGRLRETLNEIFDARLAQQELELKAMEAEIADVRAMVERRKANRERIIDQRVAEIVGAHDEALEW